MWNDSHEVHVLGCMGAKNVRGLTRGNEIQQWIIALYIQVCNCNYTIALTIGIIMLSYKWGCPLFPHGTHL